jgi:iron(III) transport system permease protein
MVLIAVLALTALVVWPLFEMIFTTLKLAGPDVRRVPGGTAGQWTAYYWQRLFHSTVSQNMLFKPLMHSLGIAFVVSICSILLGGFTAWLITRSDLPFKQFFSLAVIIPYMIPSWCKSMAWIAVFKTPRIGGTQGFLSFLNIEPPDWLAYGPAAIIAVLTIHYYAYAYFPAGIRKRRNRNGTTRKNS